MRILGAIRWFFLPLAAALTASGLIGSRAVRADSDLHHGVVYYAGPDGASDETNAIVAARYEVGITGLDTEESAQEIKDLNPAFQWFVYNSVSDNYVVDNPEHTMVETIAARHGWHPDIAYLHYYDDTEIWTGSDTLRIAGWLGGSAARIEDARLPVYTSYYLIDPRIGTHFATPMARQLQMEVVLALSVDSTFAGTTLHPDGIFFDNAANRGLHVGTLIRGGHVFETPESAIRVGTPAFDAWWWDRNLGPFLTAIKDTLEASASWTEDGRRKCSMINVANYETDAYVLCDAADVIFKEFEDNPVRCVGADAVPRIWRTDSLAAASGITYFYSPTVTRVCDYGGEISYGQALLGGLASYLMTRTAPALLFIQGANSPDAPGWDTLTWRGCIDVADGYLGHPTSAPYAYAEGTDPTGKPYRVWARDHENGLVLLRNRGRWDEGIEPETAVTLTLPGALAPISPEGEVGEATASLELRNGTGAILIGGACQVPGESPVAAFAGGPLSGVAPLTVCFTDQSMNGPTSWSWDFGDGGRSIEQNPCHTYLVAGTYAVRLTVGATCSSDTVGHAELIWVQAADDLRFDLGCGQAHPTRVANGLAYSIPSDGDVRLELFGVDGRRVALLDAGHRHAGSHVASLRAPGGWTGVHLARLRWEDQILTRRIVLVP